MRPRLAATFLLIVFLPLVILAWFGVRLAEQEREDMRQQFQGLLLARLGEVDTSIARVMGARENELISLLAFSDYSPEHLRELTSTSVTVRQFFLLDSKGSIEYPSAMAEGTQLALSQSERAFLERTRQLWVNREIPTAAEVPSAPPQQTSPIKVFRTSGRSKGKPDTTSNAVEKGWHVWHSGSDIDLIYWWRTERGDILGAELNLPRLMADIIAVLPGTAPTATDSRTVLYDSLGTAIYQWGTYRPGEKEKPIAVLSVSRPLNSWTLASYVPSSAIAGKAGVGTWFNTLSGVIALALTIMGLAVYFFRENTRDIREASQRMSFVNQVSHELKTPLTSIRMYAEMLDERVGEEDLLLRQGLQVIVAESQRLSRLIGNVLTFSRKQRSAIKLRMEPRNVDETLRNVVGHFEASLRAKGIEIRCTGDANHTALFDCDILEQIIGNLLSNVEKYARSARYVAVESTQTDETVTITVTDDGPGIPEREHARVFEPFYRVSNRLTDGVAGTGIGLSIARDLARLHGGDLVLRPSVCGACFCLTIRAFQCPEEEHK